MKKYIGKMNITKDDMLFVVNGVFEKGVKTSETKENILKMMPEIYDSMDSKEIIKLLPYETYKLLEELIEYVNTNNDIEKFYYKSKSLDKIYLQDAMIIINRIKGLEYSYSINPGVIEKLKKIFSKENKKIAQRYGKIEKLTKGMLYSYGVVELNFFRAQLCNYMSEIITLEELYDLYYKRLNLNTFVEHYTVKWNNTKQTDSFITYLNKDEIDVGDIAAEQKSRQLQYKKFSKQNILERKEYCWDLKAKKLYEFIKERKNYFWKEDFEIIIKRSELGENILSELTQDSMFKNESDIEKFMELFIDWYNNSPQYILGGYSPIEFKNKKCIS